MAFLTYKMQFLLLSGQKMEQTRETEIPRGSRDAEDTTASKHSSILRHVGKQQEQTHHCTGHRANDIRNA